MAWVKFDHIASKTKTNVYNVLSKDGSLCLGQVKWLAQWRCYCFFPGANTVFDTKCVKEIIDFIESLMRERKEVKHGGI
jgi:hypothetical protein